MLNMTRYGTRDLERAKLFYDAIAVPLGAKRVTERANVIGYKGPEGGMLLIGEPFEGFEGEATPGNGTQVALTAPDRASVDRTHATALAQGGVCAGAPGLRGPEEVGFYAAYFRDPDGNKIMIFRVGPAD